MYILREESDLRVLTLTDDSTTQLKINDFRAESKI